MDILFFSLAFSAILFAAYKIGKLAIGYFDDEIRRRSGVKPKSGNADLD